MHNLIILVRHLRRIAAFKVSTRALVITLMVLGAWVATIHLEFPPDISINDKLIHVIVFFGFALLMDLATSRSPFWLWKGLPLLIYGGGIEVAQYFTEFRSFSLADWFADFAGILLYYIAKSIIVYWDKKRSTHN
ncbi:VanZ family protein [Cocleimonas sp. KMM 6892]|uniref:VanZ family protein n=1 Tax=unclassified Cocleimonas TaxID=2639732 RepID=UPI002DB7F2DB|nr:MULTISPECIES: VanZ family protein [unclassified Cocleimonas]MEB8432413.1 VanZ family protein [Cocleimonas sp. KMM 6892]MEC4715272.1 VanZ family protein [Cocleimonas sp. KMM 6895]MEC4745109.1 VanZ family protein [Cocleimonas sp. KMM 6896]